MIDALFGSKTRVKLLHLFLNNQGKSFYVREITRKIDEQINSVRRELSNMLEVGIITCDSADNKLYYQVNQRYEFFLPLKAIFSDTADDIVLAAHISENGLVGEYAHIMNDIAGLRLAIFSGVLVRGSTTSVDVVLVGNITPAKVKTLIKTIEKNEGREINYSILSYDDFHYRLGIRDRFITEIMNGKHEVIIDKDNVLNSIKENEK
ncbi:transcriptional regulator [Candidatus Saccharibacteria bacterium HGW-Saccharibacteria-1]|jgi:hypothetical protein|nr:MAG: transcriptional regulator [Candidatus Saccharibacteria bacterium HGW-Saccharibacteria-1]